MKKIIIGIIVTVCLTLGFAVIGSGKHSSSDMIPGIAVEKAFASPSAPDITALDHQQDRGAAAFSWPTLFYLYTMMIVVVSVRRNTSKRSGRSGRGFSGLFN
jgi:hypothetical protein